MVRLFYSVQTWFEKKNIRILRKITYKILNTMIRVIVPLYYKCTPTKQVGITQSNHSPKIIISLTSFPPRMDRVWMVLESLLRQTVKANRIILWLASSQFDSLEDIDSKVLQMRERGLEIRFCDDLKGHKKYYYSMLESPNDVIVTVDDDIFYPENMLEGLLEKHKQYPDCVVCYRAHKITFDNKGNVNSYLKWLHGSIGILGPDHLLLATNGGGSLYPPNCLNSEVFNKTVIQELCLNADDIWLKCMAYLNDTKIVKVYPFYSEIFTTYKSDEHGLAKNNVIKGENDLQLQNVMQRYNIRFYN